MTALSSDCNSMLGVRKGDRSKTGHQTRATDHTSHIGMNTTEGGGRGGGALSISFNNPATVGSASPTAGGSSEKIMNYPYSYD